MAQKEIGHRRHKGTEKRLNIFGFSQYFWFPLCASVPAVAIPRLNVVRFDLDTQKERKHDYIT